MRVLMIDPSFRHQGHLLKFRRIGYFPLTLPRLAACLPPGVEVTLIHEKAQEVDTTQSWDLVLFTTMGSNLARAEELSAVFRANGARTVVGGFSVRPFLGRCREHFDAVVLGDGEGLLPLIIADAEAGRLGERPGRVYENLAPPIDHLPVPRYDLVPREIVGEIVPLEASRGCPNCCDFCAVTTLYGPAYRQRNPAEVLRDLNAARTRFGRRMYFFTDPNFTADMAHAKEIIRGLVGQGIAWLASVDIRALEDDEFLRLARDSGCFSLQIGFETLSATELHGVKKGFAAKRDYGALIRRAQSFGIPIVALLMVGFDTDTPATFRELRRFLERHRVPLAVTHPLIPIPGTPLHAKLAQEARLLPIEPEDCDGLHLHFIPRNFGVGELIERYWKFSEGLFSLRSIVRRFLWPGILKNPLAYLVLAITNVLAGRVARRRLPPGMYDY